MSEETTYTPPPAPRCGDCHYFGKSAHGMIGTCFALPELATRTETNMGCVLFDRRWVPQEDET